MTMEVINKFIIADFEETENLVVFNLGEVERLINFDLDIKVIIVITIKFILHAIQKRV